MRTLIYIKGFLKSNQKHLYRMRIGKTASSAEYQMDEEFQNCQFLEPNFGFPNWKYSRNLFIFYFVHSKNFQFRKFQKFVIWQFLKISDLENSRNVQCLKFRKLSIFQIPKFSNLKNFYLGKFKKRLILEISKIPNL